MMHIRDQQSSRIAYSLNFHLRKKKERAKATTTTPQSFLHFRLDLISVEGNGDERTGNISKTANVADDER